MSVVSKLNNPAFAYKQDVGNKCYFVNNIYMIALFGEA
jgi:hypothetical protein